MGTLTIPTTELGYEYDLQIEPWNNSLQGFRAIGQWRFPLEGGLGLGLNFLRQYDKDGWCDSIPAHLLEATKDFPEYQYQMLFLAANSLAAKQLLESRPMILALICDRYRVDNESALVVCSHKQKEILSKLGLDGTKAAIKFIDKLKLDFQKGDEVEQVKRMLKPAEKRYLKLRHYTQIDYMALRLDQIFPFLSGGRLGTSLIREGTALQRIRISDFQDALMLGVYLGIENPMEVISGQRSIEAFRELHDRWARRNNRWLASNQHDLDIDEDAPYDTPLQGNEFIQPISCFSELRQEASEQIHCIAVYHNRIQKGAYLAFRMNEPERLTIGIRKTLLGQFPYVIDQICGKRNRRPSEESRDLIQQWFDGCKQSALSKKNN